MSEGTRRSKVQIAEHGVSSVVAFPHRRQQPWRHSLGLVAGGAAAQGGGSARAPAGSPLLPATHPTTAGPRGDGAPAVPHAGGAGAAGGGGRAGALRVRLAAAFKSSLAPHQPFVPCLCIPKQASRLRSSEPPPPAALPSLHPDDGKRPPNRRPPPPPFPPRSGRRAMGCLRTVNSWAPTSAAMWAATPTGLGARWGRQGARPRG